MEFEMISPSDVKKYLHQEDVLIIDLRDYDEYVSGHIEGAIHLPYDKLQDQGMFPMDMVLLLYCDRGAASLSAARELSQQGYQVKTLAGGMRAYRSFNILTERGVTH